MRQRRGSWLLKLATVTGLAISGQSALAAQSVAPIEISSFSGAYLAARVAEVDNDLDGAIAYYKKALAFDPENEQLQQSLMLTLISQGRFDESLPYAEKLKTVAEVERFSRLALAVDAFRKKDYKAAETWLKLALESDLDGLVTKVMTAWAKSGAGDSTGALAILDEMSGPDWYGLFVSYNKGLIAESAGLDDEADAAYQAAIDDLAAGGAAPETWLRAAEAYAGFLAREGKKDAALAVLDKAEEFSSGRIPLADLRDKINKGESIPRIVATPSDGASELLLVLATALNRSGGEAFVRLYLQYALALKPDSDVVLVQLAAVSEQQQDAEGAIALYRRIPDSSPLRRLSQLQLGLNLADLDRRDEAIRQLQTLVDENPDDMRGYLALGGVYASKEDYAGAAKVYDKAVARIDAQKSSFLPKDPKAAANWNIYYQRGIAYERLKQWPVAEPNFRKALELFPNQPQVHELPRLFVDRHEHEPRRGHGADPQGGRSAAERRLHRRFPRLGALPPWPVRRRRARTRARGFAETRRRGAERPSRRCLLARRAAAGGDVPVEPCARHEARSGRARDSCRRSSPRDCRRSKTRPPRKSRRRRRRPSSSSRPRRRPKNAPRQRRRPTANSRSRRPTRSCAGSRCGRSRPTSSAAAAATSRSSTSTRNCRPIPARLMPGQELTLPEPGN